MRNRIVLLLLFLGSVMLSQAQHDLKGQVIDNLGQPLPGASILEKGTTNGVVSDFDGNFMLNLSNSNATIAISYIGFSKIEIPVDGRSNIIITLEEDTNALDEVVLVGFGTQKKVNLTGAVASVGAEEIENRPVTQSSQALSGLAAGVTVTQSTGRPGSNGASIRIRGIGTFSGAGNNPLVLVDGIAASIDDVDPNNIKSISVLKDAASASIYGTRAANGVVLIETKRGQSGKMQISYNGYVGFQKATAYPKFLNSWQHAELKNEARINNGQSPLFTAEEIELFRSGTDLDNYPNKKHLEDLINSGSGLQSNHSFSFTGGDEKNSYIFSVGRLQEEGLVKKTGYKKYNFLLNFDSKLTDRLNLRVNLSGYKSSAGEPDNILGGGVERLIRDAVRVPSVIAGRKSDGTYGFLEDLNPEIWLDSNSFHNTKTHYFLGSSDLSWELFDDFTIGGKVGYRYSNTVDDTFITDVVFNENKSLGPNSLTVRNGDNSLTTIQATANYEKNIGEHYINVLAGYSQEEFRSDFSSAFRDDFPNNLLYELNAGASSNQQSNGSGGEWALRSYFGRLNYSYKNRYLLEGNVRYDGTSRFAKNNRWGIFPSFSAGWRVSEESFFADNVDWVNNMKFRASWGRLGNQDIGNYPYQSVIELGFDYPFGGNIHSGAGLSMLPNKDITWETTEVTNFGLDLGLFNNKWNLVLDLYEKTTSDILYNISVSNTLGLTPSEVNAGEVVNKGIDVMLSYRSAIKNFNFSISPNFSYVKNEVTNLVNTDRDVAQGLFIGESLNSIYGYVDDGLFIDQNDVDTYANQPYPAEPGFIRYKDISGPDGIPDGVTNSEYDRKILGSTFPKFNYGISLSMDYKGVDFSVLLQGVAGSDKQLDDYEARAFENQGQAQEWQYNNRWTIENPNPNASYIKVTDLPYNGPLSLDSSFWIRNASYLRVKNVQLGYSLPRNALNTLGMSKLRFYLSGQNLFTFDKYVDGWDPEIETFEWYPISRVLTFGVNAKF